MLSMIDRFIELFRKDTPEDQTIDYFQLENLLRNQVPFVLLDLRTNEGAPLVESAALFMQTSKRVPWPQVESYLLEQKIDQQSPLVFVCQTGRDSRRVARALRKKSWVNVYVLSGGLDRLNQDLRPPSK